MCKLMSISLLCVLACVLVSCAHDDDPYDDEGMDIDWPTLNPNRYHWNGVSNPFFETWNWHVVVPEDNASFDLTMGVFNPGSDDPNTRGALVHFSSSEDDAPYFQTTSIRDFEASRQSIDLRIGDSRGTQTVLRGSIPGETPVTFDLRVLVESEWDSTMGILTNIPLLAFNWHVGALLARAEGTIRVGDRVHEFFGARVIADHFWGREFPGPTTRIVASNFTDPGDSFVLLTQDLLLGPLTLDDVNIALLSGGELFEFRSTDLNVSATSWIDEEQGLHVRATRGNLRIEVTALGVSEGAVEAFVFNESGFSTGGSVFHNATVQIDIFAREEQSMTWERRDAIASSPATVAFGVPTMYQDIP